MNSSSNASSMLAMNCLTDKSEFSIILVVMYGILFVVSLTGNILVMVVVYRNKTLRNSANYFIVNMAVSDLFIPILVIPRMIKVITHNSTWGISGQTGGILCKMVYFLSDVTPMVSVLSLICISCDRFCAVMFPFRKKNYVPRWFLIASTWLISFGVLSPHFYTFRLDSQEKYCISLWSPAFDHEKTQKNFSIFIIVSFIFVPFVILSFIYISISIVMINQKVIGDRSEKVRALRDRKTKTVVKLAFTIVMACAMCYGPYGVFILLLSFKYDYKRPVSCAWNFYVTLSFFLAYANAAINPTIYFLYVQSYKRELKRILTYMSRPFTGNSGDGIAPQLVEMVDAK